MRTTIHAWWANESGATAIEYALICAIMGLALISVAAAGGALDSLYDRMLQVVLALGGSEEDGG